MCWVNFQCGRGSCVDDTYTSTCLNYVSLLPHLQHSAVLNLQSATLFISTTMVNLLMLHPINDRQCWCCKPLAFYLQILKLETVQKPFQRWGLVLPEVIAESLAPWFHRQAYHKVFRLMLYQTHWEILQLGNISCHRFSSLVISWIESVVLDNNRWLWIVMFLHDLHYFSKFKFLGLLWKHQITDQPMSCRSTDVKEYYYLLI